MSDETQATQNGCSTAASTPPIIDESGGEEAAAPASVVGTTIDETVDENNKIIEEQEEEEESQTSSTSSSSVTQQLSVTTTSPQHTPTCGNNFEMNQPYYAPVYYVNFDCMPYYPYQRTYLSFFLCFFLTKREKEEKF